VADAVVVLDRGLNVVSGGSGEGKTLLIQALRFVCGGGSGGRAAAARLVRPGAKRVRVSLEVEVDRARSPRLTALLDQVAPGWSSPVVVERTLARNGRGQCQVAGRPVPLAQLRELGGTCTEVFGQGAGARLTEPAAQVAALDRFAGVGERVAHYTATRAEALALAEERRRLLAEERALVERWDALADERRALMACDPEPQEWEHLCARLEQVEARAAQAATLAGWIDALSEREDAVEDRLRAAERELGALPHDDWPAVSDAVGALSEAGDALARGAERLHRALDELHLDQGELEGLRARRTELGSLARRLGLRPEALHGRWAELEALEDPGVLGKRRLGVEQRLARARRALDALARELGEQRRAAAARLEKTITAGLPQLGLREGRFVASVSVPAETGDLLADHPSPTGPASVAFTFAAHPEAEALPLAFASGGELARLFLLLGCHTGDPGAGLLVFDEVDQNVGARLGAPVGDCLAELGRSRQLLVVTHLAPVAARADQHLAVRRSGAETRALALRGDDRLDELALMLCGRATRSTRRQAQELLEDARRARRRAQRARRRSQSPVQAA
jgi:DNA repair protein RecN (Recombination protein N)